MKTFVAHPGLQHSHQLARALCDAGHLQMLLTGVPLADRQGVVAKLPIRSTPIPRGKRRQYPAFPILRRLAGRFLPRGVAYQVSCRLDQAFDAVAASKVAQLRPDLVVCYENSALHCFRAAKRIGALCVLDAASVHFRSHSKWVGDIGVADTPAIQDRKEIEVSQADLILTCSDFAAETFLAAGVPANKVQALPLGADVPATFIENVQAGPCRFLYVGTLRRLKGVDILLDAFEFMNAGGVQANLTLIGDVVERDLVERLRKLRNVSWSSFMPHSDLFAEMARHDVLVLPSRFDAFGMVVVEAMALGLPAVVSDRVGAKCVIQRHPGAGWVVPWGGESLRKQLAELASNPQMIASASAAARRAACDYTWEHYRARAVGILEHLMATKGSL